MSLRVMNLDVASVSAGAEIETYLELAIRYKCRYWWSMGRCGVEADPRFLLMIEINLVLRNLILRSHGRHFAQ